MKKKHRVEDIESLIESTSVWNKAAFYSDPEVQAILNSLYERWEKNNQVGEPIDYASDEEYEKLLSKARYYALMPPWRAKKLVEEREIM